MASGLMEAIIADMRGSVLGGPCSRGEMAVFDSAMIAPFCRSFFRISAGFAFVFGAVFLSSAAAEPEVLSTEGSGRAPAYIESPKIIRHGDRTHVTWLDSVDKGFRVRIRTFDHTRQTWSGAVTVGEAENNHGGPALTIDEAGFLHILYFSHHHPFRYRSPVRPDDASE